jgi:hypothetical protein
VGAVIERRHGTKLRLVRSADHHIRAAQRLFSPVGLSRKLGDHSG